MYYFDSEFLRQYIDVGSELKVVLPGSKVYHVAASGDIANDAVGYAVDEYGEVRKFKYQSIVGIIVNGNPISIDQLQVLVGDETNSDDTSIKEPETNDVEPPENDIEPNTDEPEEPESESPDKSKKDNYDPYMIGRYILQEYERYRNHPKSRA